MIRVFVLWVFAMVLLFGCSGEGVSPTPPNPVEPVEPIAIEVAQGPYTAQVVVDESNVHTEAVIHDLFFILMNYMQRAEPMSSLPEKLCLLPLKKKGLNGERELGSE